LSVVYGLFVVAMLRLTPLEDALFLL